MKAKREAVQPLLSDDELHRRAKADPEVQARIEEAKAWARSGEQEDPGLSAEDLPDYLREHG